MYLLQDDARQIGIQSKKCLINLSQNYITQI